MTERTQRVVVMTAGGTNPQVMINALKQHFPDLHVIEELPERKHILIKRRAKRLGWPAALGQLGTMIASRLLKSAATSARWRSWTNTTYLQSSIPPFRSRA